MATCKWLVGLCSHGTSLDPAVQMVFRRIYCWGSPTIDLNLRQHKWNMWHNPPPLILTIPKLRVFAPSRLYHCFGGGGGGGLFFLFHSVQGQNTGNIWVTPYTISMIPKWRLCSFAPSSLFWWGEGGLFLFVLLRLQSWTK